MEIAIKAIGIMRNLKGMDLIILCREIIMLDNSKMEKDTVQEFILIIMVINMMVDGVMILNKVTE
jgi:hypothetical protein